MSTPIANKLSYSDYAAGAAIVTGVIGGSTFVLGEPHGAEITGLAIVLTTMLTALSAWLKSKGD